MLRNIVSFIFIYIFIISCDNSILGTQECSDCVLELSFTDLEIESDGYYHLDFNQDYIVDVLDIVRIVNQIIDNG